MTTETDSALHLLTFYEKCNLALRIAIFIAVLWPFSALVAAMFLNPTTAQTIVPLIDLIPVVAAFFLIIGAPFGLALLLRNPDARKGFLYFVGFLGIELTIGVYLSVIPVSKDAGLVPLLIISALALFFLKIAGIAKWIRVLLFLLLIAITITFIAGGRSVIESAMQSASKPPVRIIDNYPPKKAQADTPTQRVEEPSPASQPPVETKPKVFRPDWANAKQVAVEDFRITAAPCILRAANLHCFFRLENYGNQLDAEIDADHHADAARIIDDDGQEYRSRLIQIGSSNNPTRPRTTFPSNIPIMASATFLNVTGARVALLDIKLDLLDHTYFHQLDFQLRDIEIQKEQP